MKHLRRCRRAAVVVLAALAGLAWPLEVSSAQDCPPQGARDAAGRYYPATRCPGRAPSSDSDGGRGGKLSLLPWLLLAGAVGVGAAAASQAAPPPPRQPTPEELLENGPVVFPANPIGTFSAYGFVQDGAPIVIDAVQPDLSATTELSVTVGGRTFKTPIDAGGEPVVIQYRGAGGAEPQVALFRLTSTRISPKGKTKGAPIHVAGIGAGRRAMGSVAINRLSFGPPQLQVGAGQAALGYVTESPFDLLATDVLRYRPGAKKNMIVVERVWRRVYRQLGARAYAGEAWDGRIDKSNAASSGVHLLQVTGWELTGDRAWVAAYSPGAVAVK